MSVNARKSSEYLMYIQGLNCLTEFKKKMKNRLLTFCALFRNNASVDYNVVICSSSEKDVRRVACDLVIINVKITVCKISILVLISLISKSVS